MKNYSKKDLQSMSDWELVQIYCDEMGGIDENDLMIEVSGNKAEREYLITQLLQRMKPKYAKGSTIKGLFSKAKAIGSKSYGKAKELTNKGVDATKKAIHDKQKKVALNVIDGTKDKVSDNKRKMILKGAEQIVADKYAKGSTIKGNKYKNGGGVDINELNMPVIRTQFEEEDFEFKDGGGVGNIKERVIDYYINNSDNEELINLMGVSDVPNLKQVAEKWVNNRDSYYDKIFSAINGIHNRTWAENKFEELGLEKYEEGGTTKGFCYTIGGL